MKLRNGGSELLIPAISAVRIRSGHGLSPKLIVSHSSQPMPQQRRSHFQRNAEILKPRGERVAQVMEVEINHLRFLCQTLPEDAERGWSPSSEDSPVHMGDRPV
ncbi:MAG: hypothetical protein OEV99_12470 [Nitrospira sp.]|nr:hypothetical protein [Nitrospira sp.]MDH4370644.1 hypothetical protein [Nitrospira sp.]MDH5347556.1 hypothetical protein [Nitrospira sp.]MDH5496972.1 hypothetical protein [Nitrospira sp.]MDH5726073.1 hypothetical protein [Nitrospira sp.]